MLVTAAFRNDVDITSNGTSAFLKIDFMALFIWLDVILCPFQDKKTGPVVDVATWALITFTKMDNQALSLLIRII
jgi:hypothetical protein